MEVGLSTNWLIIYAIVFVVYTIAMYFIGWAAERRIDTVDDYLVAGRKLPLSMATATLVATWFGAEVLLQTTDEVYTHGLRSAVMDPLGTGICLVLAGWLVAIPMWRLKLTTLPDYFWRRFGRGAEVISAIILVPSYFGWVASQFEGMARLFEITFGLPLAWGIVLVAVLGTGYTVLGGMWSVTWTDAVQLGFIFLGLLVLAYECLTFMGGGSLAAGFERFRFATPPEHWVVISNADRAKDLLHVVGALAIGSLGNIPVQDLMQRMFASKSEKVAQRACWLGGVTYLAISAVPIGVGLSASLLLPKPVEGGVLTAVALHLLSPFLLLLFLLAVVSAVLSTISSAIMAAASILGQNLILHVPAMRKKNLSMHAILTLQRWCVVIVAILSLLTAFSGRDAHELLRDAYSMTLVGLFVPLMGGLYWKRAGVRAAWCAMLAGIGCWLVHWSFDWEFAFQGILESRLEPTWEWIGEVPQELLSTFLSALGFALGAYLWPNPEGAGMLHEE